MVEKRMENNKTIYIYTEEEHHKSEKAKEYVKFIQKELKKL